MGLYLRKTDGTWHGSVANGNAHVKWAGSWYAPNAVYCKVGAPGGGSWHDTGYRGYPNPPTSIGVYDWNFGAVALQWGAPNPGGAPTTAYHLVQTDQNGNWLNQVETAGSPWGNFGVSEDGYYQFYVRSKSAGGLYSAFTGPVRVKIGHTEQGYTATENRTRYWSSPHLSGYRNRDDPFWVSIPSVCVIQGMHWRNLQMPASSVVTPYNNRTVNWLLYGGDWGPINANLGTVYKGNNTDYGFNNQGDGQPWGIVARGSGWSTTGNGSLMLYTDDFWCDGTETYQVNVYYVTRSYEGNSYW